MQVAFEGEIIHTQYCIENKRLDAYLLKYKIGIEIDEYDHEGRDPKYEQSRQLMIEDHWITVIRTNPDAADFIINRLINQIYMHIIKSTKKKLKNQPKITDWWSFKKIDRIRIQVKSFNKTKVFKMDS